MNFMHERPQSPGPNRSPKKVNIDNKALNGYQDLYWFREMDASIY
jgi:hypothetical protein